MTLGINTIKDDNRKILVLLQDRQREYLRLEIQAEYRQAEKLLCLIEQVLAKAKKKLSDIKKIKVVNEGGSFTSLRIGLVTANALGYALKIPVVAWNNSISEKMPARRTKISIVKPKYSSKPNITKTKNKV